jgi:hypothetical protein
VTDPTDRDTSTRAADGPDRADTERALRALMQTRVWELAPPVDVYPAVVRRHRRGRRRAVLGASLVATAVLAGTSVGVTAYRVGTPGPTAAAAANDGPRGSLAGDGRLLAQARALAQAQPEDAVGRLDRIAPGSARVLFADQVDGFTLVLVVGRTAGQGVRPFWFGRTPGAGSLTELPPGGTDQDATSLYGGVQLAPTGSTAAAGDVELGQRYVDPVAVLNRVMIGDRSFGVAVYPPGSRAMIVRQAGLHADCLLARAGKVPLPLQADGTSMFGIDRNDMPVVSVWQPPGRVTAKMLTLPPSTPTTTLDRAQVTAQVRGTIRGTASDPAISEVMHPEPTLRTVSGGRYVRPVRYVGLWAGPLPWHPGIAVLYGEQYASGATLLFGFYSVGVGSSHPYGRWAEGCVPAGRLDSVLVTQQVVQPDGPLIVVGPARAARAEAVLSGGAVVPVPLTEGGGFLVDPGGLVVQVRAYDDQDRLLGVSLPGRGLVSVR